MPREWGKTLSSHISEPKVIDHNNDDLWEHLHNRQMALGSYRKYKQPKAKGWKMVWNVLELLGAFIIFFAALYKLGVQFI